MNLFHRLLRLSRNQILAIIHVILVAFVSVPLFWLLPSSYWVKSLTTQKEGYFAWPFRTAMPEDYVWAVNAMSRYWHRGVNCVFWTWIGLFWLRRCGEIPVVKVGVKAKYPSISAHAWLLWQGRVVVGDRDDLSQYRILYQPSR